jgi:hypothetical protein
MNHGKEKLKPRDRSRIAGMDDQIRTLLEAP